MQLSTGTMIGPYRIVESAGSGGMGHVYKAVDTRLNRPVALKVVKEDLLTSREHLLRFEREARTLAALNHPNICVLHDVFQYDGMRLLVMEFAEGETLAARLQRGPMKAAAALACAREIAAGLAAAHARGIVHRDLKPSNVMLTKSGAKLLDFGLAKTLAVHTPTDETAATPSVALTQDWAVVGTFPYMAPERLEGRSSDVRGDVFAFGALLYEMLSGRRAFGGDSPASGIAHVLKSEPDPILGLTPAMERVIRKCLAKDPDDRWQTIGDAVEGLELASTAPGVAVPRRSGRRRWIATAAVVIALAAAWFSARWIGGYSGTPRPVVVLMDSTLPERVYDPATRQAGGTNSDDVTDVLRELPLELHKETTSALWRREEQVLEQRPALIVMHLSSFAEPGGPDASHQPKAIERTQSFLGFVGLASPKTRFIVYTRGYPTEDERQAWVDATVGRFPVLRGRLHMMHVPGGDQATFRDPRTRELVRQRVQSILGHTGG